MFHHQPVAWVLGETLEAARDGARRVIARIRTAAGHSDHRRRDRSGELPFRTRAHGARRCFGAIAASALQFSGELAIGGQEHFYLETQCAIAWHDETGGIAVDSSTQHPAETQDIVARVLGVARHQVTVECLRMGGAFGGKEVQANAWAAIAALGAWKTRRPVRVRLTRALDMALTGKRHPFLARYDSRLLRATAGSKACAFALYSDGGWSLDLSEPVSWRAHVPLR